MGKTTESISRTTISRRGFLEKGGLGLTAGACGLSLVLEACSPGPAATQPGVTPATSRAELPTYVAFQGPAPDLAGNAQGLDPAYFMFPTNLVQSVPMPPGDGTTVSAITLLAFAPPPPAEQNAAWQAVNKALNATLQMDQVPASEYHTKLNAVIAGSELPDFILNVTTLDPQGIIPALPQFLQSKCADLTPYLSGDGIKEYPNLAHYSAYSWRSTTSDGKIYAIPVRATPINNVITYRADIFEKTGVPLDRAPKNIDEFKRILQAVTRPQDDQYGIAINGGGGGVLNFGLTIGSQLLGVFRAPNNWRLDSSGKLVKDIESEEFKAAVSFARELWQLGVWHPNTPTYSAGAVLQDYVAGRFAVLPQTWAAYAQLWDVAAEHDPSARIYPMHPFAFDGGKPKFLAGSGGFGLTYIKQQSSPERLKMLLRIANFFAAPFGSTEWLLNNFGAKEVDYTFNQAGAPVLTGQGRSELTATWDFITSPAPALFSAYRSQEFATVSHAAEVDMIAALEPDPTQGLYSPTAAASAALAQNTFMSGVADIVLGRRPFSDLDGLVADWRTTAGDKMRAEFQDALQKA